MMPTTKKIPVTETIHGRTITDNFRWLEDASLPETVAWTDAQNKYTATVLQAHANREDISKSLLPFIEFDWVGIPLPVKGAIFWRERRGSQNQAVLCYSKDRASAKEVLLDPNTMSEEGLISIDYWGVSHSGKYLVYGLSENGTENATLYIMDMQTRKELDSIPYTRHASVAWLHDESGFFYTRYPASGSVGKGEEVYYQKLFLHKLGNNYLCDEMIFGEGLPKKDSIGIHTHEENTYAIIEDVKSWTGNDLFLFDYKNGTQRPVVEGIDSIFVPVLLENWLYLITNYNAPNFKVLRANLTGIPHNIDEWEVVLQEREHVLERIDITADTIIVVYLENVISHLYLYTLEGRYKKEITLPTIGTVGSISCEEKSNEFYYSFSSFFYPPTIFRYQINTGKQETYAAIDLPMQSERFDIKQEWAVSKDGTKIPLFVFGKKDAMAKGKTPMILYGYGGFGVSQVPGLYASWIPYLEKGGLFAVANIRGGGEFGELWHRGGMLHKKQNTFDDFIAASELLIEKGYTTNEKFAIYGGSNGGLLVGACMMQRPDLYKAVICQVPLLDMIRFPKFLIAELWTAEYGDPGKREDFEDIISWSPYHQSKASGIYPAVLFDTAQSDSRVDPMHARKMVALLQTLNSKNIALLRLEINAGHGAGKPLKKKYEEILDMYSFIYWQLGIV